MSLEKNFLSELILASHNKPSSLSYFHNNFPNKPLLSQGTVQAFVIGGTNYEVATAQISDNGRHTKVIKHHSGRIPQFIDADSFLQFIGTQIDPKIEALAINFAYNIQPTVGTFGEVDGILVTGTKEHVFKGLIGKAIGAYLKQQLHLTVPVTIVNDTVCLGRNSLVVGSGFNICFNNINFEAGNFDKFDGTPELEKIDRHSEIPGIGRYEKMLSGVYLPHHYNLLAKKLGITTPPVTDAKELSRLAVHTDASGLLARILLIRSAGMVAAALAAVYEFSGKQSITFTTDGSLFWKGWKYKTNVEQELIKLGIPEGAITFDYRKDAARNGALTLLTRTK